MLPSRSRILMESSPEPDDDAGDVIEPPKKIPAWDIASVHSDDTTASYSSSSLKTKPNSTKIGDEPDSATEPLGSDCETEPLDSDCETEPLECADENVVNVLQKSSHAKEAKIEPAHIATFEDSVIEVLSDATTEPADDQEIIDVDCPEDSKMEIEDAPVEIEACDVQETTDLTRPPSDHTSPSRKLLERLAIPAGSQDPTIANLYQCLQTMASSSEETSTEFMAIYSMLEGKLQTVSSSSGSSSEQKPRKDPFQEGSDMYINSLTLSEQRDAIKNILANAATAQEVTPKHLRIHTPKDMTIQLMEHQKLGVEWMLNMERGSNKGGILADDMGLGKTIQSISTIVENQSKNPSLRATLIVATMSLLSQWEGEIKTRVKPGVLRVLVYYGSQRPKNAEDINSYDVVLTTYGTIVSEWPRPKKRKRKDTKKTSKSKDSMDEDKSENEDNDLIMRSMAGPLFRLAWHRIILDEAHSIKNRNSLSYKVCVRLESLYRWCLTGTPIQNDIGELYSLIRFLRIPPYDDHTEWKDRIAALYDGGQPKIAMKRLQTLMAGICLRRRKTDELDGQPLVLLPPRDVILDMNTFNHDEEIFYRALEQRTQLEVSKFIRAGTFMKNYSCILLLFLRLRQAVCHPKLVTRTFEEVPDEYVKSMKDISEKLLDGMPPMVRDRLLAVENMDSQECPICFDALQSGVFSQKCGHVFCKECIFGHLNTDDDLEKTCPACRGPLSKSMIVTVKDFFERFDPTRLKPKIEAIMEDFLDDNWVSSTKIDRLMAILDETRRNYPLEKTIVFSQFRGMLDLCETPLRDNKYRFLRFDGSMNAQSRKDTLELFRTDPTFTVILVSLKCGSLGLNLTCANHVCLMDFWWNPAVENQAIDRVHRLGQTRPVQVHRVYIQNSVEDRILALQAKKQQIADSVLNEGGTVGKGGLNQEDLLFLFDMDPERQPQNAA